jgi:ABC-type phosphate/phosphonate transport system substrate-binding protein
VYGGVIFALANNTKVNTIYDLKDKIIGAGSPSVLAGGQVESYEMQKAGLSYINDPKQMVYVFDQDSVVKGVLDGSFDVGFVRTDQIEQTMLNNGHLVDPNVFKVSLKLCEHKYLTAYPRMWD